jgi:DNA repair exonuclease SbcCD nuclease subunit
MRKVIASADHHFDPHSVRWGECVRVHEWIARLVETEQPDLFVSGGDIYEKASTPEGRTVVADWLARIAEVCPVLIARGNHDRHRDLAILGRLRTKHPVVIEEAAGVHVLGGIAVAAMAWPMKASLMAMLGRDVDLRSADDAARTAIQDVLRGLGAGLDAHDGLPRLGVGHWMIDGSMTSGGQPLWGQDLRVGLEDLALMRAPLVVAGHIHKPQEWTFGDVEVVYPGSPFRTAYGETECKGVLYAEWHADNWTCSRIATPAQQMVLVEATWTAEGFVGAYVDEAEREGADVRFRYHVAPEQREAAKAAASEWRDELLGMGVAVVKVEEIVRQSTTARSTTVAEAKTTADKLGALWTLRGEDMAEGRRSRVLGRLGQIEGDAA